MDPQVALSQRLGYANVFDAVRPAMHYRLRMWHTDEHQMAWRLHRMALTSQHSCFRGFSIDGVAKKIKEDANLWSLMRGNAGDKVAPTVTLDFDFEWEVRIAQRTQEGFIACLISAVCKLQTHASCLCHLFCVQLVESAA